MATEGDNKKLPRVLLAGNPNVGKTTLFNALTGLRHKVANYPGVTVEERSGVIQTKQERLIRLVDLPGTYSLQGESPDEQVAVRAIAGDPEVGQEPDLVVIVVNAANLERNLYLTTQILDLGRHSVIALNMLDLAERRGIRVLSEVLARKLGVPVIPVVGSTREGISDLVLAIETALFGGGEVSPAKQLRTGPNVRLSLVKHWTKNTANSLKEHKDKWDEESPFYLSASSLGRELISKGSDRYRVLNPFGLGCRILREPGIFGLDLRESREKAWEEISKAGIDPASYESVERYKIAHAITNQVLLRDSTRRLSVTSRLDRVLLHRFIGLLIFGLSMMLMFQSVFALAAIPMEWLDLAITGLGNLLGRVLPAGALRSLVVDGVVAGVGGVIVFVPQIFMLYLMVSLFEDSGYLARVAFLMDRVMRVFGLQGRSFIPLLNSFGCAIPGIMATRVIPSWADRMRTILVAPLMSCSARLPVYTVLIAAFIPNVPVFGLVSLQGTVLFAMYVLGIVAAALVSLCFRFTLFKGEQSEFLLELPPYRVPSLKSAVVSGVERVGVFVRDAGTVILACSVILWFLASFPREENSHIPASEKLAYSYAGRLGKFIEPIIQPLGFDWRIGVGIISSFAAREVFVSTLSLVLNLENEEEEHSGLSKRLQELSQEGPKEGNYQLPVALSLMVFYCFACQCMGTLAICRRETNSLFWPCFMFLYMTVLAYGGAWLTYKISLSLWY